MDLIASARRVEDYTNIPSWGKELTMKSKWMIAAVAVCLAAGCVPSVHPWYADKDVTFEEKLLGTWKQDKEDTLWTFEKGEGESKGYRLTIISKDKDKDPALLEAHLFKINGKMYLDTYPGSNALYSSNDFLKFHLAGTHMLYRLDTIQPTIEFRTLNPDTIGKMLKDKPELIAHESPSGNDGVLLTAPTEKLQKFIAEHAEDEKFFGEANALTRRSPLFAEKDFGFEPKLVGRWIDGDGTVCISEAVKNESYRIIAIQSTPEGAEVHHFSAAVATINNRRFVSVYESAREIAVSGGSDADRTPDLLLWIEQVEPTPQYRVMEYAEAAEIVKMNDEQFKSAVEKLAKVRWTKLVEEKK
jgi:hypothetical protein